jgi:hypothetical protein
MGHPPDATSTADATRSRTPTRMRGKVFPGQLDCIIIDFSRRGARLRFSGQTPTEDRIVVVIWSTGIAIEACRCWRDATEAGWQFLSCFDLRGVVPEPLADVKVQWLDRRHRLRRRQLQNCGVMIDYRGTPRAARLS